MFQFGTSGSISTPERLHDTGTGQLLIHSGGGCLALFGLPFLGVGIMVLLMSLGVIEIENEAESEATSQIFLFLFGAVFAAVGGALVFGRKWTVLDRMRGTVVESWGLLVPMRSKERPLMHFTGVRIEYRSGNKNSSATYPVVLAGREGTADLTLTSNPAYARAREQGETIARFLSYRLTDRSTHHEVDVPLDGAGSAWELEQSVVAPDPGFASPPSRMRSTVGIEGNRRVIDLPPSGLTPGVLLPALVPLVFALVFLVMIGDVFIAPDTSDPGTLIALALFTMVIMVPLSVTVTKILKAVRGRTRITVGRDGIEIAEHGAFRWRKQTIPKEAILGLDYAVPFDPQTYARQAAARSGATAPADVPPQAVAFLKRIGEEFVMMKGITLKTRAGLIAIARGLPHDEVAYLYGVMVRALEISVRQEDVS